MSDSAAAQLPAGWFESGNQVVVLVAPAGRARRELLEGWLRDAAGGGA